MTEEERIKARDSWFKMIDKLSKDDEEVHNEYVDYKLYQTKSSKLIHLDKMDNDCLLNCLNYVRRNKNYPHREGYIDMMERVLRYRLIKEGKSMKEADEFINGGNE